MKIISKKLYLYLIVLFTGAITLALELIGTRILAPFYGTTVYVWSSLIGVTLLSLSFGYYLGGKLSDLKPEIKYISYILLFAGLSVFMIIFASEPVLKFCNIAGARFGALLSALLLFSIPLLLMGMITPYSVRILTESVDNLGTSAGSLYAAGTVGSFTGAILTGFFLIPSAGIRESIAGLSIVLIIISSIGLIPGRNKKLPLLLLLISFCTVIFVSGIIIKENSKMNIIYEKQSAYSSIKVALFNNKVKILLMNGAIQAICDIKKDVFTSPYLPLFSDVFEYNPAANKVLSIGLGAGAVNSYLKDKDVTIDNVEVDPEILNIAKKYFDFQGDAKIDDGRHYVKNTSEKYDVIFIDVFGGRSLYPYIFSVEAASELNSILNDNGIIAINSVGYNPENRIITDKTIVSMYSTLKKIFKEVKVKATNDRLSNFVIYASNSGIRLNDSFITLNVDPNEDLILTDNHNPLEYYTLNSVGKWRDEDVKFFKDRILM